MTTSAPLSRPQLRRVLRQRRRALSSSQQRIAARNLYRQPAQSPAFRRARHIALYLPNDGEIDPRPLLAAAQKRGKRTYLPVLSAWPRTKMVFQQVTRHEQMAGNRFRILAPGPQPKRQRRVVALRSAFRRARHIALYLPNDGEIDPRPLLAAAQKRGKRTYLPVLSAWPRTKMVFQQVTRHEKMAGNRFRILEPRPQPKRQRRVWAL